MRNMWTQEELQAEAEREKLGKRDYTPGDLLQCSRILRDDMALRDDLGNGRLAEGRILVSMSQEFWNNWCVAIGDRA